MDQMTAVAVAGVDSLAAFAELPLAVPSFLAVPSLVELCTWVEPFPGPKMNKHFLSLCTI